MAQPTDTINVCEHQFVVVKPLTKLFKKCVGCKKRKIWSWRKLMKCTECKHVWHNRCVPRQLSSVIVDRVDITPETDLPVIELGSVEVSSRAHSTIDCDAPHTVPVDITIPIGPCGWDRNVPLNDAVQGILDWIIIVMQLELYEECVVEVRVPVVIEPVTAVCRKSDSQTDQSQRVGYGLTDSPAATGSVQDEGLKRRKNTRRGGTERKLYRDKVVTAMLESIVTTVEMDLYEESVTSISRETTDENSSPDPRHHRKTNALPVLPKRSNSAVFAPEIDDGVA